MLREKKFEALLCEPSDIEVTFDGDIIGIACKKLYSPRHVQNVLSKASRQATSVSRFGIVALNIDDLIPGHSIIRADDPDHAQHLVAGLNQKFIDAHKRHLKKYLESGRLLAAIVSTSAVVLLESGGYQLSHIRQWNVWTIPGLPVEHEVKLGRFRDLITA